MNYFNYFTEIEDTIIRRRGKHLLLSPIDWALIESWKEKGVPLHVALRGIENAFDSYAARPRTRSVKSLLYCQEEVEAQYAEWLNAQVGAAPVAAGKDGEEFEKAAGVTLPFPRAHILAYLTEAQRALRKLCEERATPSHNSGLIETFSRARARLLDLTEDFKKAARPDAERLEESLAMLEKMLDEGLLANLSSAELDAARSEATAQLDSYRRSMDAATYRQTFDNLLLKRLREQLGVPRLSLFYL